MNGESHNPKKKEDWLIRIIAIPIGILIGGVGIVVIGIGMPVLFVGSIIQLFARGEINLLWIGVAIVTGYVAWKFWVGFPKAAKEQFQSFKQWLNRKKNQNETGE